MSHKQLELFSLVFRGFPHSWSSAAGLDLLQSLFAPAKLLDDGIDGRCPDERLRVGVPRLEEFFDGGFEVIDTDKDSSANAFAGQFSEPTLNQIQPA